MPKQTLGQRYRSTNGRLSQCSLDMGVAKQLVTLAVGFDERMFLFQAYMITKDSCCFEFLVIVWERSGV